jgi:pimeloyl-ACP methyl ester carboxylesterase
MDPVPEMYADFQRNTVAVNGAHVSYLHRKGRGAPLVLIPGSFSDSLQWADVVPGLDAGFNVLLVELRGHGGSWPPSEDGSIEQFAADVLLIADDAGIGRFYVGGHSIGGMVALEVGRVCPGRVKGVLSVEGWTDHRVPGDAFDGDIYDTLTPEQDARRLASRARVTARWSDEQRRTFGSIWRRWDGYAFLCETGLPVLEIYGDRGRGPASREQLHIPDRPNIEVLWIEGASHSLPLERPAELATAFNAFVSRMEGGVCDVGA